jgi:hypothetical protein
VGKEQRAHDDNEGQPDPCPQEALKKCKAGQWHNRRFREEMTFHNKGRIWRQGDKETTVVIQVRCGWGLPYSSMAEDGHGVLAEL